MKVYVLLAEGFETIEALTPIDVMKRAAIEVETVAVADCKRVVSSHGIVVVEADMLLSDADLSDGDALILPGGNPGYVNLATSAAVGDIVGRYYDEGRIVAAICGAPTVLAARGIACGRRITAHSSVREQLSAYDCVGGDVVVDGNLITGAGAGVSVAFSLAVLRALTDDETCRRVASGMEVGI
ncbi:MAG: DJ-1/PfpI family protein [Alistipes sp.]|nr:DJ-1/PfpI family protein [Alistipes sp.]